LCSCRSFIRKGDLEDEDNAVDVSNTPLLRGFMYSLVKEGSTDGGFTAMKISKYNFLLVETKVFSLRSG